MLATQSHSLGQVLFYHRNRDAESYADLGVGELLTAVEYDDGTTLWRKARERCLEGTSDFGPPYIGGGFGVVCFKCIQLTRAVGKPVSRQQAPFIDGVRCHAEQQRFGTSDQIGALDAQQAQVDFLCDIVDFGTITDAQRQVALEITVVALNDARYPGVIGLLGHRVMPPLGSSRYDWVSLKFGYPGADRLAVEIELPVLRRAQSYSRRDLRPGIARKAVHRHSLTARGIPALKRDKITLRIPATAAKLGSMSSPSITQLLSAWQSGDQSALNKLAPVVYAELHRLAQHYMRGEATGHTLQATALVNEAYIRLVGTQQPWQSRAHFLGVAAQMMRRILVDHARARGSHKRGSNRTHVDIDEVTLIAEDNGAQVIELDAALKKLSEFDERKSKLIELRFFGGRTYEEAAEVLAISTTTLDREMRMAKAWLKLELAV